MAKDNIRKLIAKSRHSNTTMTRRLFAACALLLGSVSATIYQNTQQRDDPYPGQATVVTLDDGAWNTYPANASEISYKGRWDSKHISWWSAPGIKVGFTGDNLALSFGQYTSEGVLTAWRLDGQDWQFANVTANTTYQYIDADTTGFNLTNSTSRTFEMRVTNWAYGVQLESVSVDVDARLYEVPRASRTVEIIGDSLSSGQYATYEGISSWAWGFAEGLGDTEFSITAYPGICLVDTDCWGNPHGQTYQWYKTSDTGGRAIEVWGDEPEEWDFSDHSAADLVVINIGTNDNNTANNVSSAEFQSSYIEMIDGIHRQWPASQIVLFSLWIGFDDEGSTFRTEGGWVDEIESVYAHYQDAGFVHYFNTTGLLQHNDMGPLYHPTDIGHIKLASNLLQYVKLTFGWDLLATGPEVQSHTLYWNDQASY